MPIYESETITRAELEKKRKYNQCAVCAERLSLFWDKDKGLAFLACNDWTRTHHEGIMKANNEHRELNIPTRRENIMAQFGEEKAQALEKYQWNPTAVISREVATEIVKTLWPGAPDAPKAKAILLCATYNLNPLMNHLFLLPFKNKETGQQDWVIAIGIEATRLMSHRKHKFTYLDLTPRRATKEELEKILGPAIEKDAIYFITKIKDLESGAEGYGLGSWKGSVYGADKGNTPSNMAAIRSERQALKRLYPAEMPSGVEVFDEHFIPNTNGQDVPEIKAEVVIASPLTPETPGLLLDEPQGNVETPQQESLPPDLALLQIECLTHGVKWIINKFGKRSHKRDSSESGWCNFSDVIKPLIEEAVKQSNLTEGQKTGGGFNEWLKEHYDGRTWSKLSEDEQLAVIALLSKRN